MSCSRKTQLMQVALGAALLALPEAPAAAQQAPLPPPPGAVVRGRVVTEIDHRLSDVDVRVAGTNLETRTNADGEFILPALVPGPYLFLVRRVGYVPRLFSATLSDGTLRSVIIELQPAAVELPELTARGTEDRFARYGRRLRRGVRVLTRDDLQRWERPWEAVRGLVPVAARVELAGVKGGLELGGAALAGNATTEQVQGTRQLAPNQSDLTRSAAQAGVNNFGLSDPLEVTTVSLGEEGRSCLRVSLNGAYPRATPSLEQLTRDEVEAMEVLPLAEARQEWPGLRDGCGVVLVWR